MSVDISTQVGPQRVADGPGLNDLRQGKLAELIVGDVHGRYSEPATRGLIFSAANQAPVSSGAGLTASGVNFTLYNPAGSGVLLSLLNISIGINAAPAAASIIYLVQNNNPLQAAPATTTALVVGNNYLGPVTGTGKAFSTATLAAAPTVMRPIAFVPAAATITGFVIKEEVAGMIVIPPGCYVSIEATTVISLICSMDWEEIPLI